MPPVVVAAFDLVRQNVAARRRQLWIGLLLALATGAGAGAAWWYQERLTFALQMGVWGVLVLALAILARKGWIRLFGPVLFYDAIRSARRSRYLLLRCLYATAFLFVLHWTYSAHIQSASRVWMKRASGVPGALAMVHRSEAAELAASFFYNAMKVQFLALLFFTPAYAAGAIAEEKERKTMEFLLATDLHSREIVLSKLVSRLGSLALLVLTGLPILSILQLMGGIDPDLMVAGFALTCLSIVSLAAVSLLVSAYARRPRAAIVLTYLILIAYWLLASWASGAAAPTGYVTKAFNAGNIFAVLAHLEAAVAAGKNLAHTLPALVRGYAFFHLVLAAICTTWTVARLRGLALRQSSGAARQLSSRAGLGIRPRVGRLPMIWKEIFVEPGLRLNGIGWLCLTALLCLSFYLFAGTTSDFFDELLGRPAPRGFPGDFYTRWIELGRLLNPWLVVGNRWNRISLFFSPWVRVAGTLVASLMLVGVAVRASSSISGERDRETLDGLLTSPLQSHDILFGKWLGSLLGVRRAWICLGLIWGVGVVSGGLHPASLMLTLVAWLVYASCLAGIGLWFSISCRTSWRATLYTLAVTFGASVGHWALWFCLLPFCTRRQAGAILGLQGCITPPAVLYSLSAPVTEVGHSLDWDVRAVVAGFGLFLWALAACIIWSISRTRFRRLASRMPNRRPEIHYLRNPGKQIQPA